MYLRVSLRTICNFRQNHYIILVVESINHNHLHIAFYIYRFSDGYSINNVKLLQSYSLIKLSNYVHFYLL